MTLIYVCTDYCLNGPSEQEIARIGLLLSGLYMMRQTFQDSIIDQDSDSEIKRILGEIHFIDAELDIIIRLLGRPKAEIMGDLEEWYNER